MPHWASSYIGWPYERCAQGPDLWDCWSFVRHIQREQYGREVPFAPSPTDWRAVIAAIPTWAAEFGWRQTQTPRDGDAVFMSRMRDPSHVGVWIGDLKSVLHCPAGGSVLHDARHLAVAQWRVRGYFTPEA